jgi:hypothetical protein
VAKNTNPLNSNWKTCKGATKNTVDIKYLWRKRRELKGRMYDDRQLRERRYYGNWKTFRRRFADYIVALGVAQSVYRGATPGRPEFDSRQCTIFFSSTVSRPALGPTQPPIQWVPGALSPGLKWQEREADRSLPSNAEVKNGGAISPLPPYVYMA